MTTHENKSIKNWAEDERPREKLESKGKESLSNSELLAIIIGSGSKNKSAVALSKEILESCNNNLSMLNRMSLQQLKNFKGIGTAKAIHILATLELGNRKQHEEAKSKKYVSCSKDSYELMRYHMQDLQVEESWVLYLNKANAVLYVGKISAGGIANTVIDSRLIFSKALELKASNIILAHNHPSGNLNPSKADRDITLKIKSAGEHLDIRLLDHIIITDKAYYSFADEGFLN
ncbi:MAG: DNA repair protein RadC [Saprospiraceae bacterium]|nr:DNA repair protein RadC [Saprospiraceae bacterium]